ncbi:hypothetical protein ABVK25_010082 [Lepraria finkii]|uniref:C2H2-type domain-containing protein n=1 Tax=Lepraria finkii TaxID=1340010 RepID=A0ABR4AXG5_9LECA
MIPPLYGQKCQECTREFELQMHGNNPCHNQNDSLPKKCQTRDLSICKDTNKTALTQLVCLRSHICYHCQAVPTSNVRQDARASSSIPQPPTMTPQTQILRSAPNPPARHHIMQ